MYGSYGSNNDGWWVIAAIAVVFIATVGIAMVLSSDMPAWAKYLILMG